MTLVQRSHGGHQGDGCPVAPPTVEELAELGDGRDRAGAHLGLRHCGPPGGPSIPASSIVPAPSGKGPLSWRDKAFSTALRTRGARTAPDRATPMPSSSPLAWSTIALENDTAVSMASA